MEGWLSVSSHHFTHNGVASARLAGCQCISVCVRAHAHVRAYACVSVCVRVFVCTWI